jgi:integrase
MQLKMDFDDRPAEPNEHADNEPMLRRYRESRRSDASASTVASEVSQLRSLACDARLAGASDDLALIAEVPQLAARLLMEPSKSLHRSTMQTRLRALHRLIRFIKPVSDAASLMTALDWNLGATPSRGWHDAGVTVAGRKGRAKARMSIPPEALDAILRAGEADSIESATLAGLLCFSGIQVNELIQLRWSQLTWGSDQLSCTIQCRGPNNQHTYLVMPPGVAPLFRLLADTGEPAGDAFIFPGRKPSTTLAPRTIHARLARWAADAGWRGANRNDLVSALAGWMHDRDIDDHSIKIALGRRYARTVDRLLAPHRRSRAQQEAQSVLVSALAKASEP